MVVGEKIYSSFSRTTYTIFYAFKAGSQAEVAYATSDKSHKVFFIKRLLSIKYSSNKKNQEECLEFEKNHRIIYDKINSMTIEGASCTYINDFFREGSFYYVVTMKIDGFDLLISDISKYLTLSEKVLLCKSITYSFYPLEYNKIIHGDIKPENFILKRINNHFVAKMVDLESAFMVDSPPPKGYVIGTEPYYSPELVDYNTESNNVGSDVLSSKSDIFSLGIIFYEIFAGEYPVKAGCNDYIFEIIKKHHNIIYPSHWPEKLTKLIKSMLQLDPKYRPDILSILRILKNISSDTMPTNDIHSPYVKVSPTPDNNADVHICSLQSNCKVFYSLEGAKYIEYNKPFSISDDDLYLSIKVIKNENDYHPYYFEHIISVSTNRSGIVSRPTISVTNGIVTISCLTPNVDIYFTTNKSKPTKSSQKYQSTFTVPDNTTIKAIAYKKGMYCSDVVSLNSSSKIKLS